MSLQATFTANFDAFNAAIANAQTLVKGEFEPSIKNLQSSLTNMAKGFSGANIIGEAEKMAAAVTAVGGAAVLTDREQQRVNATVTEAIQKYERLGQEVPAHLRELDEATKKVDDSSKGWSLSAGAVASAVGNLAANALSNLISGMGDAIQRAVDMGGKLTDLSGKTGISTKALQELQFATDQTGGNIETVTGAIVKMGLKLAGGNDSAAKAVSALGLSFSDLRGMTPEQAFYTITDAVAKVQDPMAQAKLATDLFGKAGTDLLPTINDASGGFHDLAQQANDLGIVMSDETVKAMDDLGDSLDTLKAQSTTALATGLAPMVPGLSLIVEWAGKAWAGFITLGQGLVDKVIGSFYLAQEAVFRFLGGVAEGATKIPILGSHLGIASDAAKYFKDQAQVAQDTLKFFNDKVETGIDKVPKLTSPVLDLSKANQDAARDAQKSADALAKVAGQDKIDAANELVQAINKYGLEAITTSQGVDKVHDAMKKAIDVAPGLNVGTEEFKKIVAQTMIAETHIDAIIGKVPKIGDEFTKLKDLQGLNPFTALMKETVDEIPAVFGSVPEKIGEVMDQAATEIAPKFGQTFLSAFGSSKDFGAGLSSTIVGAVMGGGDVGKAAGAFIGDKVGAGFTEWAAGATDKIGGSLGGLLGGAANAVLPGVGALLGAGFSAITDKLFKGEEKKVNDLRDQFIDSAGGLDALNLSAAAAGLTLDKLLDAKKTKNFESAIADLKRGIEAHQQVLADFDADLTETLTHGALLTDELGGKIKELFKQDTAGSQGSIFKFILGEAQLVVDGLNTAVKNAVIDTKSEFTNMGIAAVAAFDAAKATGATTPEAFAAIKPSLDGLREAAEKFGFASEGAFHELLDMSRLSDQFGPLLSTIGGLGQQLSGLSNLRLLDEDSFKAITSEMGSSIQAIVNASGNLYDTLRLNQGPLQTMWELEEKFGFKTDEATQKLIDQAAEAGIVGGKFASEQERMVSAINGLISRMDVWLRSIGIDMPASARDGVGQVNQALQGVSSQNAYNKIAAPFGEGLVDMLPWAAREGVRQVNDSLDGVDPWQAFEGIDDLGENLRDLQSDAYEGVSDVNYNLAGLDVDPALDSVGELEHSLRNDLPDAVTDSANWVAHEMGYAQANFNDVDAAAQEVVSSVGDGIAEAAQHAEDAINDFANSAVYDLQQVEDAGGGAGWGSSPTGVIQAEIGRAHV